MGKLYSGANVDKEVVTKAIAKGVVRNIQRCPNPPNVSNILIVEGDNNVVEKIVQQMSVSFASNCWMSATNQQDLVQDIVQEIITEAKASGGIGGGLIASTNLDVSAITELVLEAMIDNVQECSGTTPGQVPGEVENKIQVTGNFNRVSGIIQETEFEAALNCYFDANNLQDLSQKLENVIHSTSAAGKKAQGDLNWLSYVLIALAVIFLIGVTMAILRAFSGGKKSGDKKSGDKKSAGK